MSLTSRLTRSIFGRTQFATNTHVKQLSPITAIQQCATRHHSMTLTNRAPLAVPSSSTCSSFSTQSSDGSASTTGPSSGLSPLGTIPVIDLSGTFGSGADVAARRAQVAAQIDRACRDIGFFTIVGHGINEKDIDAVWKITQQYFDRPVDEKNLIPMNADYPYGYSGFGGESLSKGYGEVGRPDPKECFAIGPSNPKADMPPVQWPKEPKEFQQQWTNYYGNMEKLAAHLLSLFALALKLPENWFENKIDHHRSALRALNYPKLDKPLKAGEVRAGAHTGRRTIDRMNQRRGDRRKCMSMIENDRLHIFLCNVVVVVGQIMVL